MAKTMNKESMKPSNSKDDVASHNRVEDVIDKDNIEENSVEKDRIEKESADIAQLRTPIKVDLSAVYDFLGSRTTQAWVDAATADVPLIIQDHANCEKSGWYSDESIIPL